MPDEKSIKMLYALRIIINIPLIVTSGARCETYNISVGGKIFSTHLYGAFDVQVPREKEWEFVKIAQFVGFNGIGIKNNKYIHIDRFHEQNAEIWTY